MAAQPEVPDADWTFGFPRPTAPGKTVTDTTEIQTVDHQRRWRPRRALAWGVRVGLFLAPVAASMVFVLVSSRLVPKPGGPLGTAAWWIGITAAATLVLQIVDRQLQRFIPVVALLRLSLVFPDHAPSRFRLALRRGTINQFEKRLDNGELGDTPQLAAEMLLALVARMGQHDRLTRGHSERVRAYTMLIAEEMQLRQADRDLLQWAALLHDVGKLDVPADLLNKNGAPTPEEWEVIRRHPRRSEEHLAPLAGWLGDWRLAASQHHERWDGAGYPRGLRGEQISLAGRIVAVADAYDTITSVRSYKKAASAEEGRAEIARCAGSQFDPVVVRAFLAVSLGRIRGIMGPVSWLAQAPILASVPAAAPAVSGTLTASAAVVTMGMSGMALPPPEVPEPVVVEEAADDMDLAFVDVGIVDTRPLALPALSPPDEPPSPTVGPTVTPTPAREPSLKLPLPTPTPGLVVTIPTPTPGPRPPTPTSAPAPTPTPRPTSTPAPTPTSSPTPFPTAPPTATSLVLYLANPGSGNTASSPTLGMSTAAPTDALANFDTNRNTNVGLTLRKTNAAIDDETDPTRIQLWTHNLQGTSLTGPTHVHLWAAPRNFDWDDDDSGVYLRVGLDQCNLAMTTCVNLGAATRAFTDDGGGDFASRRFDLGDLNVAFDASRPMLALRVISPSESVQWTWVAYDAIGHEARIELATS